MNFRDAATQYHAAGLKVIPFWTRADSSKIFPPEYAKFRDSQTAEDIARLFAGDCDGICLLCTDGIEAIDVDTKHDPTGKIRGQIIDAFDAFDFKMQGVVQRTKSDGLHMIYRCPAPDGNRKLAKRRGEKESMIETRGRGGLLFITPTPGYEILSGTLFSIPTVTQEERDFLINMCAHFDEPDPVQFVEKVSPAAKTVTGKKPWEAFDECTDILDMMGGYGWKVISRTADYVRLNRPGAKHSRGIDGSVIVNANLFYPFTSSEQFAPNKAYGPASVYAILEHNGDFSAAAKALYQKGFGDRIEKADRIEQVRKELPSLVQRVEASRFDVNAKRVEPKSILRFIEEGKEMPVAGRGMLGVFTGHEKSGKSFVLSCITAAGIRGNEVLNFTLDRDSGKILLFDTEQSEPFFWWTQARIHRMAGYESNPPHYAAYHLRPLSADERMEVIEYYIYNTPGVSVVFIDGFVDLANDYNDLREVQGIVGRLMKWSDERKVLIMGVLHVNKGDGKIRGHFGSELKNKCDFIIHSLKTEDNRYTVSNPTGRYRSFDAFEFTRDEEGLPVYQQSNLISTQFPTVAPSWNPAQVPAASRDDKDVPF